MDRAIVGVAPEPKTVAHGVLARPVPEGAAKVEDDRLRP